MWILFHIIMVSFGLTAVLLAVPLPAYTVLKTLGTIYLLYLVYQAIKPKSKKYFDVDKMLLMIVPKAFHHWFFNECTESESGCVLPVFLSSVHQT